ncbi:hypothetical protein TEA_012009 [Camellia sinensis var. sinensis]|uniref:Uncharacterized protein n=1 Tax=Camellia sinensis var. sinensis TaxID=542762 RepID=A0A4S4DV64_CAMSN|nr:hypothetical protein TEA_012009 [Camellia sinensis var. sinensis]
MMMTSCGCPVTTRTPRRLYRAGILGKILAVLITSPWPTTSLELIKRPSEFCFVIRSRKGNLVVHTLGPFQQAERCTVLEAAIKTKTAYIDTTYAWRTKSYMRIALAANISSITAGGIYQGVSNGAHTFDLVKNAFNSL